MLSDKELIDAYVSGGAGVPGIRAVAEAAAKQALEDAVRLVQAYAPFKGDSRTEHLVSILEEWAASISTDKAGEK